MPKSLPDEDRSGEAGGKRGFSAASLSSPSPPPVLF